MATQRGPGRAPPPAPPRRVTGRLTEAGQSLLLEAVFFGSVADLTGDRFHQRGQIPRRSRGGCPRHVVAAEAGSDGADELGQLGLDDRLHFGERCTGGRERPSGRDGSWRGVRLRYRRRRDDGGRVVAGEQAEEKERIGKVGGRDAIDDRVREGEASRRDLADVIDRLEPALGAKDQGDDFALPEHDARRLIVAGGDEHGAGAPGRAESAELGQELGIRYGGRLGAHATPRGYGVPRRSTASFTLARSRSMARARLPISSERLVSAMAAARLPRLMPSEIWVRRRMGRVSPLAKA